MEKEEKEDALVHEANHNGEVINYNENCRNEIVQGPGPEYVKP